MRMINTNYRGETQAREITPVAVEFYCSEYHGACWHLKAYDEGKHALRDFKLEDCDFMSARSQALTEVIIARAASHTKETIAARLEAISGSEEHTRESLILTAILILDELDSPAKDKDNEAS